MKSVLIVSNGHGEDSIGAALALELSHLGYGVVAVPLVGRGMAYESAGFAVLGPRKEMPSGGLVWGREGALWADLKAGWLSMSLAQYHAIAQAKAHSLATLAVGDVYSILVSSMFGARPLFQVQTLVSVRTWEDQGGWRKPYGPLERVLMRRARRVYARDLQSAQWLSQHGVAKACCLGNPMLDAVAGENELDLPSPYLLLLPGSRNDAYLSLRQMLEVCRLLSQLPLLPVVAWSGLPLEPLEAHPWRWEWLKPDLASLSHPDGTQVYLAQNSFRWLLQRAKLALATTGTAAEQTAGFVVPIVSFVTGGSTYTPVFAQYQQRLLGAAITLSNTTPSQIAQTLEQLWLDGSKYLEAQTAGKAAMGEPGAAKRIAEDIHLQLRATSPV